MTNITPYTYASQAENLSWDLTPPHGGFEQNGVISVAAFTQAQHFPNGYIPSGTVLGITTATGLLAPYLSTATDGSQTAVGFLKASVTVVNPNGTVAAKIGCAFRVHGMVSKARLPFTSATAAAGGFLDAAAQTALKLIYVAA